MILRPIRLVIFDCDGVLIDSEPGSRALLAEEAARIGWPMTAADAHRFTGLTWSAIKPMFEARTGRVLPADWPALLQAELVRRMALGVPAMEGARAVLEATASLGLPYRVASNSSHEEMATKFGHNGLTDLLAGRIHSARDVARGKPAPDVFLAAAAAEGVAPETCLVVEDSLPGLTAALAAGMQVVAFAPEGVPDGLPGPPHHVVTSLADVTACLRAMALETTA